METKNPEQTRFEDKYDQAVRNWCPLDRKYNKSSYWWNQARVIILRHKKLNKSKSPKPRYQAKRKRTLTK